MRVAVERDRDGCVAHVGRERLRIDASRDHQRGERVPALMERHRLKSGVFPRSPRTVPDGDRLKRNLCVRPKNKPLAPCARRWRARWALKTLGIGTALVPARLFGSTTPRT